MYLPPAHKSGQTFLRQSPYFQTYTEPIFSDLHRAHILRPTQSPYSQTYTDRQRPYSQTYTDRQRPYSQTYKDRQRPYSQTFETWRLLAWRLWNAVFQKSPVSGFINIINTLSAYSITTELHIFYDIFTFFDPQKETRISWHCPCHRSKNQ